MRFLTFLPVVACFAFYACFDANAVSTATQHNMTAMSDSSSTSFFTFTATSLYGEPVSLDQFKGKKVVVLNVASKCGYTPQYADWEAFYKAHGDNVVVLGFPCNDFMGQEPGSAEDIASFCQKNYGVTFPMFEKVHVKGPEKAPVYQWLTDPKQNGWNEQAPTWNFCKYVVNEKGELTHFFASKVKPDNEAFLEAVGLQK